MGRRDDAHVDPLRPIAADPLELALLKEAQQLDLDRERDLADLVEEQRALVGLLEPALALRCAPVKAPRSWPNSSLSSRVSASAAQCTLTNGPAARGLLAWSASATSSLPVPDSPVMSTLERAGATRAIASWTRAMASLSPIMPWTMRRCSDRARSAWSSASARCCSTCACTIASSDAAWIGLTR